MKSTNTLNELKKKLNDKKATVSKGPSEGKVKKEVASDVKQKEPLEPKKTKDSPARKKKEQPVQKTEEKKEKKAGISEFLRKIMTPAEGKECAVTYGEANVAVKSKFPNRKQLYVSEFDRNFNKLVKEGVLETKKIASFKPELEKVTVKKSKKTN